MSKYCSENYFEKLFGIFSWRSKKGYGSFLTFDFGEPQITFDEEKNYHYPELFDREGQPKKIIRRSVDVRGEWHLWIRYCNWTIQTDGIVLAHDESSDLEIARATRQLQGQSLRQIDICPKTGNTTFDFDLKGKLITTRYKDRVDWPFEETILWDLFLPDDQVLSVYANGTQKLSSASQ